MTSSQNSRPPFVFAMHSHLFAATSPFAHRSIITTAIEVPCCRPQLNSLSLVYWKEDGEAKVQKKENEHTGGCTERREAYQRKGEKENVEHFPCGTKKEERMGMNIPHRCGLLRDFVSHTYIYLTAIISD